MTGCTLYPLTVELVDDDGEPLLGLIVSAQVMDGTDTYALEELGNGWYENQKVPQGAYQLYKYNEISTELDFTGIYLSHMPSIYEESGGFRHVLDDRIKRMYKTPHDFAAVGFEYNAEAIQDAIFYANAEGVKNVKLPAGIYTIEKKISIPYNDMVIEGRGAILQLSGNTDDYEYGLEVEANNVKIDGLQFTTTSVAYQTAIHLKTGQNIAITRVDTWGMRVGVRFNNTNALSNVWISNCTLSAVYPFYYLDGEGTAQKISIVNSEVENPFIDSFNEQYVKAVNNWGYNSATASVNGSPIQYSVRTGTLDNFTGDAQIDLELPYIDNGSYEVRFEYDVTFKPYTQAHRAYVEIYDDSCQAFETLEYYEEIQTTVSYNVIHKSHHASIWWRPQDHDHGPLPTTVNLWSQSSGSLCEYRITAIWHPNATVQEWKTIPA